MKRSRNRTGRIAILTALAAVMTSIAVPLALGACSIRHAVLNSTANAIAPWPSDKPAKNAPPAIGAFGLTTEETDPMVALTGENDPALVAAFFPVALKTYEMMLFSNPSNEGLGLMTGQLYITYANAFVQSPAECIAPDKFDEQNAEYLRAQNFYVRGTHYVVRALDHRFRGFQAAVFGQDEKTRTAMLAKSKKNDAAALYWAGAGALAAFSLSPLDANYLASLPGSVAMLERARVLDPAFNHGAVWEVLMSFYAGAPESLGGGKDKALDAYGKALEYSKGQSPSLYIAYAKGFCIPAQDGEGFDSALDKALAIDPDSRPDDRLALTIAHRQASWLKAHKADFILE